MHTTHFQCLIVCLEIHIHLKSTQARPDDIWITIICICSSWDVVLFHVYSLKGYGRSCLLLSIMLSTQYVHNLGNICWTKCSGWSHCWMVKWSSLPTVGYLQESTPWQRNTVSMNWLRRLWYVCSFMASHSHDLHVIYCSVRVKHKCHPSLRLHLLWQLWLLLWHLLILVSRTWCCATSIPYVQSLFHSTFQSQVMSLKKTTRGNMLLYYVIFSHAHI